MCPKVNWSVLSHLRTHAISALSNYLIQQGNFKKAKVELSYIYIYIDLNYFGPRGLNKLQSGSRGVALFFSSLLGFGSIGIKVRCKRERRKNSLGHLAEDLTCSRSPGERKIRRGRTRDGERKTCFPTLSRLDFIRLDILVPL